MACQSIGNKAPSDRSSYVVEYKDVSRIKDSYSREGRYPNRDNFERQPLWSERNTGLAKQPISERNKILI